MISRVGSIALEIAGQNCVADRHRVHAVVEDRELEPLHSGKVRIGKLLHLAGAAQIAHQVDAQRVDQIGLIGVGQVAQLAGPVDAAPPDVAAVSGLVAAEVTEVRRTLEGETSFGHRESPAGRLDTEVGPTTVARIVDDGPSGGHSIQPVERLVRRIRVGTPGHADRRGGVAGRPRQAQRAIVEALDHGLGDHSSIGRRRRLGRHRGTGLRRGSRDVARGGRVIGGHRPGRRRRIVVVAAGAGEERPYQQHAEQSWCVLHAQPPGSPDPATPRM